MLTSLTSQYRQDNLSVLKHNLVIVMKATTNIVKMLISSIRKHELNSCYKLGSVVISNYRVI